MYPNWNKSEVKRVDKVLKEKFNKTIPNKMECGNDDEPNDPNKRATLTTWCKEPIVIPPLRPKTFAQKEVYNLNNNFFSLIPHQSNYKYVITPKPSNSRKNVVTFLDTTTSLKKGQHHNVKQVHALGKVVNEKAKGLVRHYKFETSLPLFSYMTTSALKSAP